MLEDIAEILVSEEDLSRRVKELGQAITNDYRDRELVMIGVLRGSVFFVTDLAMAIDLPLVMDFMAVTSYGPASAAHGVVRILKDLDEDIRGKDVLLVEDVVDTGLTLAYLLKNLRARGPASLEVCTLIDKPDRRLVDTPIRYRGFTLKPEFVVGYGLDYRQRYRNLPFIATLKPEAYR